MNHFIELEEQYGSGAFGNWPFTITRGKGNYVWDADGKKYLDCSTGIGVAILGHANPDIVQAITEQAETLSTCQAGYANDVRANLLKKLSEITPPGLDRFFLCNSGTEAVEGAIKLARAQTKRPGIISAMRGFHGRTMGALSATWRKAYRAPFEPLVPGFTHIPFGNADALREAINENTAAVLIEPVQGEAGIYPAPEGYLREVRKICEEFGTLLIFDEVQTGMGRTGKWFACEHDAIFPDIMCLSKALGGGIPFGAIVMRNDLQFERGQHGSTFGGNPLSCRVALTAIDYIERHDLLSHVTDVGAYFLSGLEKLARMKPDAIREVRGIGLMLALQLRGKAGPALLKLRESGILALLAGQMNLRFLPSFLFTKSEVDEVLNVLEEIL